MAENIIEKDYGELTPLNATAIAVVAPLVNVASNAVGLGSNSIMSGLVKSGVGLGMGFVKNKAVRIVGAGALVAGVQDIVARFFPAISTNASHPKVSVVGGNNSNQGALPGGVI